MHLIKLKMYSHNICNRVLLLLLFVSSHKFNQLQSITASCYKFYHFIVKSDWKSKCMSDVFLFKSIVPIPKIAMIVIPQSYPFCVFNFKSESFHINSSA